MHTMNLMTPKGFHVPATPALEGINIRDLYDVDSGVLLGKGGFSEVLAVRHVITHEMRALKIMNRCIPTGKKGEMVAHEKEILRRTCHPHIVTLYETIQTPEKVYFALDLMDEDLFEFIVRHKKINEGLSRKIIFQILSAVRYLHEQSVVHRDIKPENILINVLYNGADPPEEDVAPSSGNSGDSRSSNRGRAGSATRPVQDINSMDVDVEVKLADFGLAKLVYEWDVKSTPCGTSFYIAPEVIRGIEAQGARPLVTTQRLVKSVDVWSVGVVLFVLLSGRPPFYGQVRTGEDRRALLKRIDHGLLFNSAHGWDDVSDEAKDLLVNMLEQDSSKRLTADACLKHPFFFNHGFRTPVPGGDPVRRIQEQQRLLALTQQQDDAQAQQNGGELGTLVSYGEGSAHVKPKRGGFFKHLFNGSLRNVQEQKQMHEELEALHQQVIAADDKEGDVTSYQLAPTMEAKPLRPAVMNSKAEVGPGALRK